MTHTAQRACIYRLVHADHGRRRAAASELGVHHRVVPDGA
jgi:hypothetical protein